MVATTTPLQSQPFFTLLGMLLASLCAHPVFGQQNIFELSTLAGYESLAGDIGSVDQKLTTTDQELWPARLREEIRLAQAGGPSAGGGSSPTSPGGSSAAAAASSEEGPPFGTETVGNFFSTNTFAFDHPWVDGVAEFPVQGRANVAENNLALPQDRFFFYYNHFNNALNDSIFGSGATGFEQQSRGVDRYTIGVEKTFLDELISIELRMPTFGTVDGVDSGFTADTSGVGNLRIISKFQLYRTDYVSFVGGLGLTVPTGSDVEFLVAQQIYTVENQAVHFLPYLGFLVNPSERFFYQGFLQLDAPTIGNQVTFRDVYIPDTKDIGRLNDQTLGYVDLSLGYWVRRDRRRFLSKIALLGELHYATTLDDTDRVNAGVWADVGGATQLTTVQFANGRNRFNVVNGAVGIHTEIRDRLAFRMAGIVPLRDGDDRFFDSEVYASVIYRY